MVPNPAPDGPWTFTREELFALVWSEPMQLLAKRFGMSDRGLAKVCERSFIPRPGRGYWRRLELGYKSRRPPLRSLPSGVSHHLATIRLHASETAPPDSKGPVERQIAFEQSVENRVVVPDDLRHPHPMVRSTRLSLKPGAASARGIAPALVAGILDVRVTRTSVVRALRILDGICKAAEKRGWSVHAREAGDFKACLRIEGQDVGFRIEEVVTMSEIPPRQERSFDGRVYTVDYPRYDYKPSGLLRLHLDGQSLGLRHKWTDKPGKGVENCLNESMVGFVRLAGALKKKAEELAIRLQHWEEQRLERLRVEQARERERMRRKKFVEMAEAWKLSAMMRAFLDAVGERLRTASSPITTMRLEELNSWGTSFASSIDPLSGSLDDFLDTLFGATDPPG